MNRVLIEGLKRAGAEVIPCHERVWRDASDKMAGVSGVGGLLGRGLRLLGAWVRLTVKFARMPAYDVLMVGYIGHVDMFLARFLSLFRPRPLVLNGLISLHDTVVVDRGLVAENHVLARLLRLIDRSAFGMADRVLIDTEAHASFLAEKYDIPASRFLVVPVGADPEGLPDPPPEAPEAPPVTVLWFGTYIALHGVATILEAAEKLRDRDDIRFVMLGRGQELPAMRQRAAGLSNVTFRAEWVGRRELIEAIGRAHICLGVFGTGGKASRVVPCKVFDALAMARPVITGDTPAASGLLTDGVDAVLVPPGDADALARAVIAVSEDAALRRALGAAGHGTFKNRCGVEAIGRHVTNGLSDLVQG